jgi:glycosyltransferase involved in cell wall biosynthesis
VAARRYIDRGRPPWKAEAMKILVAAPAFSGRISGIQRHALNLVRCLLQHKDISAVQLVIAPWQDQMLQANWLTPDRRLTIHIVEMKASSPSRNIWYYRGLPWLAARLRPDVVHLTYPVPVNRKAFDCATVATIHDLYPYEIPENFGFPKVLLNRLILQQCLRSVDAIASVSDVTLLQMKRYMSRDVWQKAMRIYNCVEQESLCSTRSPIAAWNGEPFLLSIAQHRRNKNLPLLIRAFHGLLKGRCIDIAMKLIIVGIAGPETPVIRRLVSDLGLQHSVVFLSGLSEAELQWCYGRCQALVVPSQTEGFGLPVVEALLAGCAVVCSDIPPFREVGGEHCSYVTLGAGEECSLANAIVASLGKQAKAPLAFPQFSSAVLAKEYVSLYRSVIAARSPVQSTNSTKRFHAVSADRRSL